MRTRVVGEARNSLRSTEQETKLKLLDDLSIEGEHLENIVNQNRYIPAREKDMLPSNVNDNNSALVLDQQCHNQCILNNGPNTTRSSADDKSIFSLQELDLELPFVQYDENLREEDVEALFVDVEREEYSVDNANITSK